MRYVEAISDFEYLDLETAVTQFIKGAVPGQNPRFAPTPPELATVCRRALEVRLDDINRRQKAIRQIEAREEVDTPKNAENRARVAAMVANAVKHLTMGDAKAADDYDARAAAMKKHDAYFGINPRYTVGDPDSDGDMGQRGAA